MNTLKSCRLLVSICAALLFCTTSSAQSMPKVRPSQTVLLYADSFEGNTDTIYGKEILFAGFEMTWSNGLAGPEEVKGKGSISNISDLARIDLYFPKKANGQMIIVCPGGGYKNVSTFNEGLYVADWMLSKGITIAVVKYRMPAGHWEVPLEDVQNAFRYCRANAEKWKVDQIGVMGFSAGGHLAACASNLYKDEVTRPDFSVLIYPVITFNPNIYSSGTRLHLIGNDTDWEGRMDRYQELIEYYSMEKRVTADTPQTFMSHCTNDPTIVDNSLLYYKSLLKCKVPVEMHIWKSGGHGWGFSSEKFKGKGKDKFAAHRKDFETVLEKWLNSIR